MASTGIGGINVRQTSGGKLIFEAGLVDATGDIVTSGNALLYLYEAQDDGTFKSYDWNAGQNIFRTVTLTDENPSPAMAHQSGNNGATPTGIWTKVLSTVSGFTKGAVYVAMVKHTGASPIYQWRKFQYGSAEGDLTLDVNNYLKVDVQDSVSYGVMGYGTVTTGASTTSVPTSACTPAGSVADQFKDRVMIFSTNTTTAALRGVAKAISASTNAANPTFTVGALPATPASGDTFVIV
jgi:hypothetical protein